MFCEDILGEYHKRFYWENFGDLPREIPEGFLKESMKELHEMSSRE